MGREFRQEVIVSGKMHFEAVSCRGLFLCGQKTPHLNRRVESKRHDGVYGSGSAPQRNFFISCRKEEKGEGARLPPLSILCRGMMPVRIKSQRDLPRCRAAIGGPGFSRGWAGE